MRIQNMRGLDWRLTLTIGIAKANDRRSLGEHDTLFRSNLMDDQSAMSARAFGASR
jgi:hypothetical protein